MDFKNNCGATDGGFYFATVDGSNNAKGTPFHFSANGAWGGPWFLPENDNSLALGSASYRWLQVFATSATISTSDANAKTDITDSGLGLNFVLSLKPKSYRLIACRNDVEMVVTGTRTETVTVGQDVADDGTVTPITQEITYEITEDKVTPVAGTRHHYGLIAQEVAQALTDAGVDPKTCGIWTLDNPDDENSRQGLRYEEMVAPLIKAVQEQQALIIALTARVDALEAKPTT